MAKEQAIKKREIMDCVLESRLNALQPLDQKASQKLYTLYENKKPVFVQSTNAISNDSLSLQETKMFLEYEVTIGGKTVQEHLDVINSAKAFDLMLDLSKNSKRITQDTLLELHKVILGRDSSCDSGFRKQPVRIRGSSHTPPNYIKIPDLINDAFATYQKDLETKHPIVSGAKLHFNLVTIHPFLDGNGRVARLLHNLHLLKSGYTPIIIEPERKVDYFITLDVERVVSTEEPDLFIRYMVTLQEKSSEHYLKILTNRFKKIS